MDKNDVSFSDLSENVKLAHLKNSISNISVSQMIKKDEKTNFRGVIHGSKYYIINEIITGNYYRIFSAVKKEGNSFEDKKYSVKYYNKNWIKEELLKKFKMQESQILKYFEFIKSSLDDFKKIYHPNISSLHDYYEDDDAIYIITDFCSWSLRDYITLVREPVRFSPIPFESKIRGIIIQIMEAIEYLHEKNSLSFGGFLNIDDILVQENSDNQKVVVKVPHPYLSNLITIIKIFDNDNFPSFYSPEVLELFTDTKILNFVEKKDNFNLNDLFNKLNQNFDMWSLGYLLYEMVFETPPFAFDSLKNAMKTLNKKYIYQIDVYSVSYNVLTIINKCLQYETNTRLEFYVMKDLLNDMIKEFQNEEDFVNSLKEKKGNKIAVLDKDYDCFNLENPKLHENYSKN